MRILKSITQLATRYCKAAIAMCLLSVMVLGYLPIEILAQSMNAPTASSIQSVSEEAYLGEPNEPNDPIIITFMGEEVILTENYTVWVDPFNDGHLAEHYIGRYRHIDGERVRVDDPRIGGFSPVFSNIMSPLTANARGQITPASGGAFPPVGSITYLPQQWVAENSVYLQGNEVWAIRYVVDVGGVEYEVFCADPLRGGPEDGDYNWDILGYDSAGRWLNALRYGFPRNPYLSDNFALSEAQRIQNAYITRVAVAMGRHYANQFTGNDTIRTNASGLVNGTWPQNRTLPNAVLLNGEVNVSDPLREVPSSEEWAISERFYVSHNRVSNAPINPFQLEWTNTTPQGTQIWIDGEYHSTKGTSNWIDDIPWGNLFLDGSAVDFIEIKMPNEPAFEHVTAGINLIGVNEVWAGRVWVLRDQNNPSTDISQAPGAGIGQDLVFYIPSVRASMEFSFWTSHIEHGYLRILKTNMQDQPLGGAVFTVRNEETGYYHYADGTLSTTPVNIPVSASGVLVGPLPAPHHYRVTEITPPPGYTLASPSYQVVWVEPNHTATTPRLTHFRNEPETYGTGALRILKTAEDGTPETAIVNITGPDPSMPRNNVSIPASGLVIDNLVPGNYNIVKISPTPGNTSVVVNENHTATAPAMATFVNGGTTTTNGGDTSITIQKIDAISRENIPGAMMRLVGMSANYVTLPDGQTISFNNTGIQLMQVLTAGATTSSGGGVTSTVTDGVWTIEGLPYGMYMVYEYRAPDGFSLLPAHTARGFWVAPPNWNVDIVMPDFSLDWNANQGGSSVNWNLGDSGGGASAGGDPLAGWSGSTNVNIPGSEQTPPEFILEESPVASAVNIIFENFPFSEVKVYKREVSNGIGNNQLLEGATFRAQGVRPDRT